MSIEEAASKVIDLGVVTDWEYDQDFIKLLEEKTGQAGLTLKIIEKNNLNGILDQIEKENLNIHFLLDRASDTSPEFLPVQKKLKALECEILEPIENLHWASDKATMHLEFIHNGIRTPFTVILPPYEDFEKHTISIKDLHHLGRPFIIKPANTTGGGMGVINGAETLEDILKARQEFQQDKYLLQEKIHPHIQDGRRFWFRGFYSFGGIFYSWWNDQTHEYNTVTPEENVRYQLDPIKSIIKKIGDICKLRLYSTEIARTSTGDFIVVDYVNESCDLRLKSRHFDGIPDDIVNGIVDQIISYVESGLNKDKG